jgi:hypothetical protein
MKVGDVRIGGPTSTRVVKVVKFNESQRRFDVDNAFFSIHFPSSRQDRRRMSDQKIRQQDGLFMHVHDPASGPVYVKFPLVGHSPARFADMSVCPRRASATC